MTLRARLLSLAPIALFIAACGSRSEAPTEGMACEIGQSGCLDNVVLQCVDGFLAKGTDCNASGMTCIGGACASLVSDVSDPETDIISEDGGSEADARSCK